MSAAGGRLLELLAAGGERADGLASAICALIVEGAKLGELERTAAIGADGDWREIRIPPAIWFERLALAAERGAFLRMSVKEIVARILIPPADGAKI